MKTLKKHTNGSLRIPTPNSGGEKTWKKNGKTKMSAKKVKKPKNGKKKNGNTP